MQPPITDQLAHHEHTRELLKTAPLITIEPTNSLVGINWQELWAHRELLFFLTWRDIKVRYKQTLLGAAWAILQPVTMMVIFTLFFGRGIGALGSNGVPYPLFALTGLVPWTFFATAVTNSGNSLVGSTHLVTKIYFPRLLVPAAPVTAALVDFIVSLVPLAGAMLYYRIMPSWHILLLPLLLLLTALFALAIGTWMAALNVKYRDVRFALPFVIQIWLFVSSVIMPSTTVPERWRWVLALNPMSAIIEAYRAALLGLPFHWRTLGIATAITIAALMYSAYSFHRVEKTLADVI